MSMHRLVQAVLKDGMDVPTYHQWADRVVQAVDYALPNVDYRTYARYERCLPHDQECARLIEQEHLSTFAARWLLYKTGIYLFQHARYAEAEVFYQQSLRIWEQALGHDHHLTRTAVRNYANLLRKMGRKSEATQLEARFPSSS